MTWFVNLHELPVGQHMYTVFVSDAEPGPEAWYEEIDVVASSSATREQIEAAAAEELSGYAPQTRVVGISDQSDGYWVWRAEGWR